MKLGTLALGRYPALVGVMTDFNDRRALRRALKVGIDAIEIRVDHLDSPDTTTLTNVIGDIRKRTLPIITTIRSVKEGGKRHIPDGERVALFEALIPLTDAVDIELSSKGILMDVVGIAKGAGKRVIISHHNFRSTPAQSRLEQVVTNGRSVGGDIVKIATMVKNDRDVRKLASLTMEHKNLITIAMGEKGAASRIFFPQLGSLLTYAPIGETTAPGQLPLKVVRKELARYYV
ncbi:MAG: type I 3-dehydroquinate dehydratase [Thermodesulfobacteriota bacterium]